MKYNIYRNDQPILKDPLPEKEAREQFEAVKKIFTQNKQDICEEKDTFMVYGVRYRLGVYKS